MAHTSFGWLFGEFRAVDMATVAEPFRTAADTLQSLVFASASDVLGAELLECSDEAPQPFPDGSRSCLSQEQGIARLGLRWRFVRAGIAERPGKDGEVPGGIERPSQGRVDSLTRRSQFVEVMGRAACLRVSQ